MVIGGHNVPVAAAPYALASDVAGTMAEGEPFAATYVDGPKGRAFSLRSRGDGLDVSRIAQAYGGGGHRGAAGFLMPLGWEGDLPAQSVSDASELVAAAKVVLRISDRQHDAWDRLRAAISAWDAAT